MTPAAGPPFNSLAPYYNADGITLYHGDAFDILDQLYPDGAWGAGECVIIDPPWDEPDLLHRVAESLGETESLFVFTDARRIGDPLAVFGPPSWLFTWDTLNTWSVSDSQPVQQTKHALWYGDTYWRDRELWGDAPPARNHPTTKQTPLDGRRLTDLWRESLRWLHHPGAGSHSTGTERFSDRVGHPAMRHAKPVGWLRCLIGNTSSAPVLDPFMGSGSTIEAAYQLGRLAIGIDLDEACCEMTAHRLAQGVLL